MVEGWVDGERVVLHSACDMKGFGGCKELDEG